MTLTHKYWWVEASVLYKHCCVSMTKGPHLTAGCFPTFSTVNKTLPSREPARTSTASGRCTSYIVDIPAIQLPTGTHWMCLIALACAAVRRVLIVCWARRRPRGGEEHGRRTDPSHTGHTWDSLTHPQRWTRRSSNGDPVPAVIFVPTARVCASRCQIYEERKTVLCRAWAGWETSEWENISINVLRLILKADCSWQWETLGVFDLSRCSFSVINWCQITDFEYSKMK